MTAAISAQHVSKKYQLGLTHAGSVRELVNRIGRRIIGRTSQEVIPGLSIEQSEQQATEFWALKDVSFEIPQGSAVGIIGRNGAGKSTLLKLLSRITYPSDGRIEIRGRVASLLEVGTGFHPELTGRENVYLNGTVLGMTRADIRRRFDDIVEFAGVSKFIDTPVKRYSSGMTVRLGFAVAAHLEPDILIIDEVLAVGDVEFQQRCLGKMDEVASSGRTVLFVSHNMSTVRQLTSVSIVLNEGRVAFSGSTEAAIETYVNENRKQCAHVDYMGRRQEAGMGTIARIRHVRFEKEDHYFNVDDLLEISTCVESLTHTGTARLSFTLFRGDGTAVGSTFSQQLLALNAGAETTVRVLLKDLRLAPGAYYFAMSVGTGNDSTSIRDFDSLTDVLHFEIARPVLPDGGVATWKKGWGAIRFPEPSLEVVLDSQSEQQRGQNVNCR